MKMNKFFMLGLAGLAFAACNNEENVGNNLAGNGIVEVKIVSPTTKTLGNATGGDDGLDKITVAPTDGKVNVRLTAAQVGSVGTTTSTIQVSVGETATFYDVKAPTKVEAWINDGEEKAQGSASIETLQGIEPKDFPAYGSTTEITLTGEMSTNSGKNYEMYEATVDLVLPVARLEVSGITHVHTLPGDAASCKYATLTIDGIYLDKISLTDGADPTDYYLGKADPAPASVPVLYDEITSASFLEGGVWPTVADPAQSYNFYFYPNANQMPILKIYFENAIASDTDNPVSAPRYAIIKSYNGNTDFQFAKGTIYRITNVTLADNNIIGDEEGNTLYGVDVTVTEAKWDVQTITAEWEEQ